jgi:hypothetical protein
VHYGCIILRALWQKSRTSVRALVSNPITLFMVQILLYYSLSSFQYIFCFSLFFVFCDSQHGPVQETSLQSTPPRC